MTYDKDFLLELDKVKEKEIYAKVIALTFQETPIATIEGRVTAGSINVDGDSAVRRTCSLTIVAQNFDYSNYAWGMNTKFKLEIGVKNNINSNYPEIIWFNQGIFLITSFNTSRSATNFSISLQGKDKMCLLNGEIGGSIESSVDFGTIEDVDKFGNVRITKLPIPDIIRNLVHHYAGEPYYNIIINDLDAYGLELLEYRYDNDMYLYRDISSPLYENILMDGSKPCSVAGKPDIKKLEDLGPLELEMLVDSLTGTPNPVPVTMEGKQYYVAKVEYGQTAGYRKTDLTFAGDLIANIGESITSVLDKIKGMLSDFEYFYNLDGQFVFQKKKSFINTLWSPIKEADTGVSYDEYPVYDELPKEVPVGYMCIVNGYMYTYEGSNSWTKGAYVGGKETEQYVESLATSSIYSYLFSGAELITAFSNNPNMLNMRNDYSVWGTRETTSSKVPVHLRYAIDIKPQYYRNYNGEVFTTKDLDEVIIYPEKSMLPDILAYGDYEGEWWDIHDWAEQYKTLTGTYPEGIMGTYGNRTCKIDLNQYFPAGTTWDKNRPLFLFEVNSDGTLGNIAHNPNRDGVTPAQSCTAHLYSYFTDRAKDGIRSYIYDPTIPANVKLIYTKTDWREIIYQMAKDYFKHGQEDDFEIRIAQNNGDYYPTGMTGYEQYYTDIQGFWRDLYNPELDEKINEKTKEKDEYDAIILALTKESYTDAQVKSYVEAKTPIETLPGNLPLLEDMIKYQADVIIELEKTNVSNYQKIADANNYLTQLQLYYATLKTKLDNNTDLSNNAKAAIEKYTDDKLDYYQEEGINQYWNKNVNEHPELLNFWFDFLDDGELTNFNVKTVGARPKVINDSAVKSIYFRETPDVIFVSSMEEIDANTAYRYIPVQDIENMFSISAQGKSAKDRLDELIYTHGYCIESATVTSVPIYYLQPNTRVHLYDEKAGLNGDYIVSKITIPLGYNGTMQITATKAAENII